VSRTGRWRGRAVAIGQIAVSAGLLAWASSSVDYHAVYDLWTRVTLAGPALSVVILIGVLLLLAARWRTIVLALGGQMTRRASSAIVLLGFFFNQVLPSTVGGDAVRVWMARTASSSVTTVISSVVVDRITGLAALARVSIVTWPLLVWMEGPSPQVLGAGAIAFVATLAPFLLALARLAPGIWSLPRFLRFLPQMSDSFWQVLAQPLLAVWIFLIAVIGHLVVLLVLWLLASAIDLPLTLLQVLVVAPTTLIVSVVPISVAGWGVREGAMVVGFGIVGVPSESAIALSVMFGLTNLLVGVICALAWLFVEGPPGKLMTRGRL